MIFGTLINNNGTLRKCYLFVFFFVCGYKSLEISAYNENRIFKKKVNNFEIPRQIFPQLQQISLREFWVQILSEHQVQRFSVHVTLS